MITLRRVLTSAAIRSSTKSLIKNSITTTSPFLRSEIILSSLKEKKERDNNKILPPLLLLNSQLHIKVNKRLYSTTSTSSLLSVDILKSSISVLNKPQQQSDELKSNIQTLEQLYQEIISLNDNNIIHTPLDIRFYASKFLMLWNLPASFNTQLPNVDRMNNPKYEDMNLTWKLLTLGIDNNTTIGVEKSVIEKLIATQLSLCLEYPMLMKRSIPIIIETTDMIETNRLDPDDHFMRLVLTFSLSCHLSLWDEARLIGDILIHNFPSSMNVLHYESLMDPSRFDYYSIYKLLNDHKLINLSTDKSSLQPTSSPTIAHHTCKDNVPKQYYDLDSFEFKNSTIQCVNIQESIANKTIEQFNNQMAMQQTMAGNVEYIQSMPKTSELIKCGDIIKVVLQFEGMEPMIHCGIFSKSGSNQQQLDLFGYNISTTNQQVDTSKNNQQGGGGSSDQPSIELETTSTFSGTLTYLDDKVDEYGNGNQYLFTGVHSKQVSNTENNQSYIYQMDVRFKFSKIDDDQ